MHYLRLKVHGHFGGIEESVANDDDFVAHLTQPCGRSVQANDAATALSTDGICLQTGSVVDVHNRDLLVGSHSGRFQKFFVYCKRAHVMQLGLSHRCTVDFGFTERDKHVHSQKSDRLKVGQVFLLTVAYSVPFNRAQETKMIVRKNGEDLPTDIQPLKEDPNEAEVLLKPICILEASLAHYQDSLPDSIQIYQLPENHFLPEVLHKDPAARVMELVVFLVTADFIDRFRLDLWNWIKESPLREVRFVILTDTPDAEFHYDPLPDELMHLSLPAAVSPSILVDVVRNALYQLELRYDRLKLQSRLTLSTQEMRRIIRVGQAMSTERNFDRLIDLILQQARELVGADAGSIYVTESPRGNEKPQYIRFKKSALELNANEFLLPIDSSSIAGYVALRGEPLIIDDVYSLNGDEPYRFNFEFDRLHNYYTRSMLVIPMKNHADEVIGVIQLINKRTNFNRPLTLEEMREGHVRPFTQKCNEMVSALAGQAAVAIQNNKLLQNIHNLFEGFVKASVTAIEQRDPTTSGHSFRVAEYTTHLAMALDRVRDGQFASIRFSPEQIREIRYASLLHDFGKVGVREQVLVKAKKLYDHQMELVQWRFRYIKKALEKEYLEKKLNFLRDGSQVGFDYYEKYLDLEARDRMDEVEHMLRTIEASNEPSVLESATFAQLEQIAQNRILLESGKEVPFLKQNELVSLQVRRGTLDQNERLEIESHVTHTYRFLIQIPWTSDLRNVPDIAHGHHEKIDGSGYPLRLRGEEILPQSKMMTIADIFDALTAPDRPYKRSLSAEQALDILKIEAREKRVDEKMLDLFIDAGIYKTVEPHSFQAETQNVIRVTG